MSPHNIKTHGKLYKSIDAPTDGGGWRHLVRPIGAVTAAVIAAGTVLGSTGEDGHRDILPSTSQGDTYIRPEPQESIPLNLDGIFTEGTVGEEALPVVDSDSGICTDEGLASEESAPMYWVDGAAVQSLISAIELATIELKEAREEGGLLVGSTPDGRQVIIKFGYYLPNLPYRQVRDGAKVPSQEITTISINIKNPQGFVTSKLYIIMSGIGLAAQAIIVGLAGHSAVMRIMKIVGRYSTWSPKQLMVR